MRVNAELIFYDFICLKMNWFEHQFYLNSLSQFIWKVNIILSIEDMGTELKYMLLFPNH